MTPEEKKENISRLNTQLWQAGITGMLKGSLIGLVTGFYINYKHNYGENAKFFKTPNKIAYLVGWNFICIMFSVDSEKIKMKKQLSMEEEIKRNAYLQHDISFKKK